MQYYIRKCSLSLSFPPHFYSPTIFSYFHQINFTQNIEFIFFIYIIIFICMCIYAYYLCWHTHILTEVKRSYEIPWYPKGGVASSCCLPDMRKDIQVSAGATTAFSHQAFLQSELLDFLMLLEIYSIYLLKIII